MLCSTQEELNKKEGGGKILKPEWMSVGNKRCKIGSLLLLCSSPIGIKGLVSRLRKAVGVALEK